MVSRNKRPWWVSCGYQSAKGSICEDANSGQGLLQYSGLGNMLHYPPLPSSMRWWWRISCQGENQMDLCHKFISWNAVSICHGATDYLEDMQNKTKRQNSKHPLPLKTDSKFPSTISDAILQKMCTKTIQWQQQMTVVPVLMFMRDKDVLRVWKVAKVAEKHPQNFNHILKLSKRCVRSPFRMCLCLKVWVKFQVIRCQMLSGGVRCITNGAWSHD